jgi:hypothetical protein
METGQYVVGWFTLSLVIAGIAQGKNRSGLGWWLLGFVLGPVALVILLILGRLPDWNQMEHRIAAHVSNEMQRLHPVS